MKLSGSYKIDGLWCRIQGYPGLVMQSGQGTFAFKLRNFMHPMLNTAIKAARRAGTIINRASLDLDRLQVARKGPRNYVTEVDRAAEDAIVDVLRTAYPDHSFLCEEAGELHGEQDRKSTRLNSSHVAISYAGFFLKKKINGIY